MAFWETPTGWHERTPLHVREGRAGAWERCFAWWPVWVQASPERHGHRVWLRYVERRWFYPPSWFVPPAPWRWAEYRPVSAPSPDKREGT